ncbi:MAG: NYN domain-containing protein [Patescibacteria group bacterium]
MKKSNTFAEKQQKIRDLLSNEVALIAYLDLANILYWQDVLGWRFKLEDLISGLLKVSSIKEVKIYYGSDPRAGAKSESLRKRAQKSGAIFKTKPIKYIKKTINEACFFKKATLTLFDDAMTVRLREFIEEIGQTGIEIEEPKCNFDVEISMDMMDDLEKVTGILLFSGDSDFKAPLERLKVKGKRVFVVGVRGHVAKELFEVSDHYVDFGLLYTGKKSYIAKIPPGAGSRDL